jgi:hypothetical protein
MKMLKYDWLEERGIPDGYEPVWPNDPKATHSICGCIRKALVLKNADSHICTWLYLKAA